MLSNILALFKNYKYVSIGVLILYAVISTTVIRIQGTELKAASAKAEEAQRAYKMVVTSIKTAEKITKKGEDKKNEISKPIEKAKRSMSDTHVFGDTDADQLRDLAREINTSHGIR